MSDLAEIKSAPAGTEYRTSDVTQWQTAVVGTKLGDGYEVRNTESNEYQVELYENAGITFDEQTSVDLSGISGTVKYLNTDSEWVTVTSPGTVSASCVGTGGSSGVKVGCGYIGGIGPKPWN